MAFGLQRANMLGKLSMQLVSKISNLCGRYAPTSWTDRRRDATAMPRFDLRLA